MRTTCSIFFTLVGLAALYLFASGALVAANDWGEIVERSLAPFRRADSFALLILSLGVGSFATGVVLSPRTTVWIAPGRSRRGVSDDIKELKKDLSAEKLLEVALAINVLVVATLLAVLSLAVLQPSPPPPTTMGSLFVIAAVEVVIGLVIVFVLFHSKKSWSRRWRPVFACSAGLNFTEGILLSCVLLLGYF